MGIRELYSGNLLQEAFQRLQSYRVSTTKSENLVTRIGGPEVLDDTILMEWLAINYAWGIGFDHEGNPIMGEFGGTLPKLPQTGKLVIAMSDASMSKANYGIKEVQRSRETGDTSIISELETEIEMPLEHRNNITVINGNRNRVHYDFVTGVARNPIELIETDTNLLLSADGYTVITNKQLPGELYIFNIPVNEKVFQKLKEINTDIFELNIALLRTMKNQLIPEQFIAGFHIKYEGNVACLWPLIAQRDAGIPLDEFGVKATPSPIAHLGTSDDYGQLETSMGKIL